MAQQSSDRRVQKTQRLLRDALVSLIHEKSYDAIAVKEIVERADVGRSAFYAHFHDKDELLASGIRYMLHDTRARSLPSSARRFERVVWFSLPIFEFIGQCGAAAHPRMSRRGRTIVHRHLRRVIVEEIGDAVRAMVQRSGPTKAGVPADLVVEHIVATFIVVLNWWVEQERPLSPRQANDMFLSMILPALAATIGEAG